MNKRVLTLIAMLALLSIFAVACTTPAAPTSAPATAAPVATTAPVATAAPAAGKVPVGIVLPTKDEPRWIQDQTRFQDALKAAGYDVQILFSQGDSAKEKANVESLIS
ncbi:MAG: sugar ABC transporter substrate-binding protein, partial [Anaerolineae bacterium]